MKTLILNGSKINTCKSIIARPNLSIANAGNIMLGALFALVVAVTLVPAHADHEIKVPENYSTIQAAINAANSGDVIIVAPGVYAEQLTITKSLKIQGSGNAVVQAPATLVADSFGAKNVIDVTNGATVDVSQLTVSGPGPANCGSITAGIFVSGGATLKIRDSTITDIRDNPASGCQNGIGIFVGRNAYSTTGHADIHNVKITKYQKGGIVVDNTGSTAYIQDNRIDWGLAPLNIASNGIQISRGANAIVSDNRVTGNICGAPNPICGPDLLNDAQSTGILLFQSGGATNIRHNHVSDNDIGIAVYAGPSSVKVNENDVTQNNNVAGIILQDGTFKISENKITGTENVGIGIIADSENTFATLDDNKIKDATTTIATFPVSPYTATFVVK